MPGLPFPPWAWWVDETKGAFPNGENKEQSEQIIILLSFFPLRAALCTTPLYLYLSSLASAQAPCTNRLMIACPPFGKDDQRLIRQSTLCPALQGNVRTQKLSFVGMWHPRCVKVPLRRILATLPWAMPKEVQLPPQVVCTRDDPLMHKTRTQGARIINDAPL